MPTPKHSAVYARVSTRGQDVASQLADLKRWVEQDAAGAPVVWYRDKASGKTMDRPGWNRLAVAVEAGAVSRVVVWRLDRLGRTAKGLTALFDEWSRRKVNLISLREGIDLATPSGRMVANVLASMAQFETEVRGERVAAGLDAARSKGVKLGRPRSAGAGTAIKVTADHRRQVHRLVGEGMKKAAVARLLNLSRDTVYGILKSGPST